MAKKINSTRFLRIILRVRCTPWYLVGSFRRILGSMIRIQIISFFRSLAINSILSSLSYEAFVIARQDLSETKRSPQPSQSSTCSTLFHAPL
jgi:hypothetical protein